ncbi:hypothetical protein [Dyadobacter bucti]|uniref:hypothetical protein n=1 Tax=Dyadobacter bucti TaxID=2572203 RepID=UPI003F6E5A39
MKTIITTAAMFLLISGGVLYAQSNTDKPAQTTPDATQTQGSSAQGTSAWPQSTGTAGSSRDQRSNTGVVKPQTADSTSGTSRSETTTQTQGSSAQGTSAWPLATGTAGSTIPVQENADSATMENKGSSAVSTPAEPKRKDSKKRKNKNKNSAEAENP